MIDKIVGLKFIKLEILFSSKPNSGKSILLVNGKVVTRKSEDQSITFATVTERIVPLGVSGLNSPGRYMSNLQPKKKARF